MRLSLDPAQVESLRQFAYGNAKHVEILKRKREWFTRMKDAYMVLWWVPAGHRPTPQEALVRLDHLTLNGPGDHAFGWESLPNVERIMQQRCA